MPCHGYVVIPKAQEKELDPYGTVFHRRETHTHDPLYAIVKDLLPADSPPFSFSDIPTMRRNVLRINQLGIVIYDLRAGNYMNGILIDLSQANTVPHRDLRLDVDEQHLPYQLCSKDFAAFDGLVSQWNNEHPNQLIWERFLRTGRFRYNLRESTMPKLWFKTRYTRLDAAEYDWEKAPQERQKVKQVGKPTTPTKTTIPKASVDSGIKKKGKPKKPRKRK